MSLLERILLLVIAGLPIAVVYVSPRAQTAAETFRIALPKVAKLLIGTAILIAAMQVFQLLFLP